MSTIVVSRPLVIPESLRRALLACGILSSLEYFLVANVFGPMRLPGYSVLAHAVSELSAVGVASRPLLVASSVIYGVLVAAFGVGVWVSAGAKPRLRVVGGIVFAFGIFCLTGPLTPMHPRGTTPNVSDVLHVLATIVDVLLILASMAWASTVFGGRFRVYTFATIAVMLVFGGLTSLYGPAIAAGQPTPWAGLFERVNIVAYLVWFAALAIRLMRWPTTSNAS